MTAAETQSVVERFYEGSLGNDLNILAEVLDPDVVVHEAPSLPFGGAHIGRTAVLGLMRTLRAGIDLDSVVREDVLVRGERAAAFLKVPFVLPGAADVQGMPIVETFIVRDGLITEIRPYYFDTAGLVAQMSATPGVAGA